MVEKVGEFWVLLYREESGFEGSGERTKTAVPAGLTAYSVCKEIIERRKSSS